MFNSFNLLGLWVKLGIIGAILAAIIGAGWYAHHQIYQSGYDDRDAIAVADIAARDAAAAKAVADRITENETLRAQYAAQHKSEGAKHEKELSDNRAALERNAGRRVSVPADFCRPRPAGPTEAAGAGSTQQAAAGTWLLPERFTSDLRQLAARADEVVADARAVQSAVKSSGCF